MLPNGDFVVSEWGNKRLQIFDIVGKPVALIGQGLIGPQGVAITLKVGILMHTIENLHYSEISIPTYVLYYRVTS